MAGDDAAGHVDAPVSDRGRLDPTDWAEFRATCHRAVDEMGSAEGFRGYPPAQGYDFLIDAIREHDYRARGVELDASEIFVSDGSKQDSANLQEIFGRDCRIAVTDPVYPVYVDSTVMAGRTGGCDEAGRYAGVLYLPCTAANDFEPPLPDRPVDLVYLCFPNNPTGAVLGRGALGRATDGKSTVTPENLEVCVLEKARIGRKFRRLDTDELRQHLGG